MAGLLDKGAAWLNSLYLPTATPELIAASLVAVIALAATAWMKGRANSRRATAAATVLGALREQLAVLESQFEASLSDTAELRARVDHLSTRQEARAATGTSSLRQAIALSRHGATTRQLIDTCGLSQGEAHLIQTLYGRSVVGSQAEELH
jgi:hypothetical protein